MIIKCQQLRADWLPANVLRAKIKNKIKNGWPIFIFRRLKVKERKKKLSNWSANRIYCLKIK